MGIDESAWNREIEECWRGFTEANKYIEIRHIEWKNLNSKSKSESHEIPRRLKGEKEASPDTQAEDTHEQTFLLKYKTLEESGFFNSKEESPEIASNVNRGINVPIFI